MTSDHAPGPRRHPRPPPTRRRRMDATHRHHPLRRRRPRTHTHRHQGEQVTTRIHDLRAALTDTTYVGLTATGNTVTVRAINLMGGTAEVDRAEFLAAVANELDVIVTPRTDLPAVEAAEHGDGSLYYVGGQLADTFSQTPEKLRHTGRRFLALAEHLEQNPPIDDAPDRKSVV